MVEAGALPYFHFDGQTIVLEDYLEILPENETRIRRLVKAGKVQVGPWYVLADSFLVSGESLIRNLELGSEIASRFGTPLQVGYLPDQFGHIAQMPQILRGFGLKNCVTWRGIGADISRNRFIWSALDGSEVFTVYLPFGYSNGANLPLESAASLDGRLKEISRLESKFALGSPILVMNGTDHTEPDRRLAGRLGEIAGNGNRASYEIGTLEGYFKRLAEVPADSLERHLGELRSPLRAHLLPGVTSARTWIKQRDFENCYLLERLAGPLAALAALRGVGDFAPFLKTAWKNELQNHPHDSICGCSIDQVHDDMKFRFDQAGLIADMVVRRASEMLLGADPARSASGGQVIGVFTPGFYETAAVSGEVDVEDSSGAYEVESGSGARIPVSMEPLRAERIFDTTIPAIQLKGMVEAMDRPILFGRTISRYRLSTANDGIQRLELWISRSPASTLDVDGFKREIAANVANDGSIQVHSVTMARARVAFVGRELTHAGFSFYRLAHAAAKTAGLEPALKSIESEFYRVSPSPTGLTIEDKASSQQLELSLEDEGDRGDEYNFDPVAGDRPVTVPSRMQAGVIEAGPARRRLRVRLTYEIPEELSQTRQSRSGNRTELAIELFATVWNGLRRVDFEARLDNRARDHRLRTQASALSNDHWTAASVPALNRFIQPSRIVHSLPSRAARFRWR